MTIGRFALAAAILFTACASGAQSPAPAAAGADDAAKAATAKSRDAKAAAPAAPSSEKKSFFESRSNTAKRTPDAAKPEAAPPAQTAPK